MSNILITGGSGLIGTRLTELLIQRGHQVSHLGRKKEKGNISSYTWDIEKQHIEAGALQGKDTIIHLAGAGIADKRWTDERKKELLESRTKSTRLLHDTLKKGNHTVKSFISSSAVGYYGFRTPEAQFSEDSPPGDDFLAYVTRSWEDEADAMKQLGIRVVKIRTGIVLSRNGGVLKAISKPVKFYVGSPLGSGEQQISWIHLDDHCGILIKAVEDQQLTGAYNSVSPHPVTNRVLTKAIAKALHKPLLLPAVPTFALKLVLGEMSDLVLYGSHVLAVKILRTGYTFRFEHLDEALRDLLVVK